ncbi:MAG: hypothetical protein ACRDSI_15085 [Pseudonocardiaceae bacterium]
MTAPRHDRDDDSCPGCGATTRVVQLTSTPRVQSWECACGTGRAVIALADQANTLTDPELRDRLTALADRARKATR